MVGKWIAFYVKYLSEYDPFAIEVHGWECTGESKAHALTELEKNPAVPYSLFLAEIIPLEEKDFWVAQWNKEAKVLGVVPPKWVMHHEPVV